MKKQTKRRRPDQDSPESQATDPIKQREAELLEQVPEKLRPCFDFARHLRDPGSGIPADAPAEPSA